MTKVLKTHRNYHESVKQFCRNFDVQSEPFEDGDIIKDGIREYVVVSGVGDVVFTEGVDTFDVSAFAFLLNDVDVIESTRHLDISGFEKREFGTCRTFYGDVLTVYRYDRLKR